ncbi:MAG: hypothetical protein L0227_06795 [Chloroflexi bacterium]|nr:hypothetical protein [Chloroflexota bacterium]
MVTPKRKGRRWLTALATLAVITGSLYLSGVALAVHDETFQLDGDVIASTTTNAGGSTQTVDWDSIFTSAGAPVASLPSGYEDAAFTKDFLNTGSTFITSDTTTFATGSKDTLPIADWQCNFDNNVNSKIDVMNAYTVAYNAPNGDEIIYFALERNTNTGDANVAFWFLQDEVGCSSAGGAVDFTGGHTDGDVLVVSEFSNGGDVSTINVYRWDGDDATGSLNPNPIGDGVDCRDAVVLPGDDACAAANTANITTPWLTAHFGKNGVGHTLETSEFFEGGINLTDLDLGGKCFNSFLGDTRSSTSLTATLFDYAGGTVGACTSTTVTTPSISSTTIPADPADASVTVHDTAAIDVEGVDTFSGSVSFHLCGPMALASTDLCTSGGVDIGSVPVTADGNYDSADTVVTSAGRYCWRADFSGDAAAGVPGSSDSRSSECFVVNPVQPQLSTDATDGPVDFGQPISDVVNLTGTAHKPGTGGPAGSNGSINPTTLGGDATGNIIVKAYGPDSCTTVAFTSGAIAASGDGTYGGASTAFEFTPTAPGQYVFVASYAGDSPNTLAISEGTCASAPEAEKVTVRQIPTEIKTKQSWFPNDTALISSTIGNLGAGGTVEFSLYDNATCSGAASYSETKSITGGAPTETVSTNNTTFNILTAYADAADSVVSYSWKVVYTPAAGDTAHTGIQSSCHAEHFSITYTNSNGPGSDLP